MTDRRVKVIVKVVNLINTAGQNVQKNQKKANFRLSPNISTGSPWKEREECKNFNLDVSVSSDLRFFSQPLGSKCEKFLIV